MKIHASGEDYLEAVLILQKKQGMVRSIDLARYMGFSKPSISHAVGVLKNGGFLTVDDDGFLHLTVIGREIAEKIYERHFFLWSSLSLLASIRKQRNKTPAGLNTPSVIHLSESCRRKYKEPISAHRLRSALHNKLSAPSGERKKPLTGADNFVRSF